MKSTVQELENELKEERTRLRALTTEQTRAERQKDKLSLQLQRAESVSLSRPRFNFCLFVWIFF